MHLAISIPFAVIMFVLTYLCLIGSLFNRYLHYGKITKAFNLVEIYKLIRIFDTKSFLKVLIAVIISQAFALTVIIGFYCEILLK